MMNESNYLHNIQGCLAAYRDSATARDWLQRANREQSQACFANLLESLVAWLTARPAHDDVAEQLLRLLAEFDPKRDGQRRSRLETTLRLSEEQRRNIEERERKRQQNEQEKRAASDEQRRIAELHHQELAREAARRAAREQEECDRRAEFARQEKARRRALLGELRQFLETDFLRADEFYERACSAVLTPADFAEEKRRFVRQWLAERSDPSGGTTPDDQQIDAVAAVHGHVQVVARAGSGKTSTLVDRSLFLLGHCGVRPDELLILAFNRKAAWEIRERLLLRLCPQAATALTNEIARLKKNARRPRDEPGAKAVDRVAAQFDVRLPHVMTFHALAYAIFRPGEQLLYDDPHQDALGLSRVVQQVVDDHLRTPEASDRIRAVMLDHFRQDWERIIEGNYHQSPEEQLRYRRSLPRRSLEGYDVKSWGEKMIADFLFEHDIPYGYEFNEIWNGINYRPDFMIPSRKLIIEYFGLQGDSDYDEMTERKRQYWQEKPDWQFLEVIPSEIAGQSRAAIQTTLKARLEAVGVSCVPLSDDEIWQRIRDRAINRFTKAITSFIGRCRQRSLSPDALRRQVEAHVPLTPVEGSFLDIATDLYRAYLERLSQAGEEDFNGLMQQAAQSVESGETSFLRCSGGGNLGRLRHICVDEFQDFSDLFHRLLQAIRVGNDAVQLFCVGDDWQAINGFAGSDLRFFESFEEIIGPCRRLPIATNYRSAKRIVDVGNALMSGHGEPAVACKPWPGKILVADLERFQPTRIEQERHPGDNITPALARLTSAALDNGQDVVMLSRMNSLAYRANYDEAVGSGGKGLDRYLEQLRRLHPKSVRSRISIATAHKYKGLQRSMVIVLDAVDRRYPLIHPDWVFARILGDSPEKIIMDERRLFYVALTRAIESLVIITEGRRKSPFLAEIEKSLRLPGIVWNDFPPIPGPTQRRLVRVGNQERRAHSGTYGIKDLLKAEGYQWRSTEWSSWEKSFPAEGFSVDTLRSALWAEQACGVEVRIHDDRETLMARYLVDAGKWHRPEIA